MEDDIFYIKLKYKVNQHFHKCGKIERPNDLYENESAYERKSEREKNAVWQHQEVNKVL